MHVSKFVLRAGLAGAALLFFGEAAMAQRVGIILYKEDNFNGESRELRNDVPDFDWIHFDDRVSSIVVRRGVWELCTNSHYRGRCITVDHDISKLSRMGMDDQISSARRIR